MRRTTDSDAMNQVGKPDAENPHVRFDERGQETGSRSPRLSSTLLIYAMTSMALRGIGFTVGD